jgi:hypothetical protein
VDLGDEDETEEADDVVEEEAEEDPAELAVPGFRPGMMAPTQPNDGSVPGSQGAARPGIVVMPPQPQVPPQFRNPFGIQTPVQQPPETPPPPQN